MTDKNISINQNVERLKRYAFLEQALMRTLAGWLPGVPEWEPKNEIGLHVWEDADSCERLRVRLRELRTHQPERGIPEALHGLARELDCAQNTLELLATVYLVVKKALLNAYRRHPQETYPVPDRPTVKLMSELTLISERQAAWAEKTFAELSPSHDRASWQPWQEYVAGLLAAAEGVDESEPASSQLPARPAGHSLLLPWKECQRELGWPIFNPDTDVEPDREKDPEAHREWRFKHYLNEITAAETLGSILWMTPEMPWEFQYNTARHLWDEVRHSQLGQMRIQQLGYRIQDIWQVVQIYNVMMTLPAVEQYALLTTVIEPNGMPEKRTNIAHFENIHDDISAQAVSYDWNDENYHVRWGKKWTPVLLEVYGYKETPQEIAQRTERWLLANTPVKMQARMAEAAGATPD
jgi:Protein of unknown function (DUF455)